MDKRGKLSIEIDYEQYRFMVDSLNMSLDYFVELGVDPSHPDIGVIRSMLKTVLVAGLRAGWSNLPSCFKGDEDIVAAGRERHFDIGEDVVPDTVH